MYKHFIQDSSLESPWSTFYSSYLNLFRYLLRLKRYKRKSVEVGVFRRGWVILSANFRRKGLSPVILCLYNFHLCLIAVCQFSINEYYSLPITIGVRKLRVIALSCGIKIYAVHFQAARHNMSADLYFTCILGILSFFLFFAALSLSSLNGTKPYSATWSEVSVI